MSTATTRRGGGSFPVATPLRAPVVVGWETLETAASAVLWAAQEAARRGVPLQLVHPGSEDDEGVRHGVDRLTVRALEISPHTPVSSTVVDLPPAEVLSSAADGASLLVVGGGRAVLATGEGPVLTSLLRSPGCPVVVVAHGPLDGRGGVVVLLEGAEPADDVVDFAAGHAAGAGSYLTLVRVVDGTGPSRRMAGPVLDQDVARVAWGWPQLVIRSRVARGWGSAHIGSVDDVDALGRSALLVVVAADPRRPSTAHSWSAGVVSAGGPIAFVRTVLTSPRTGLAGAGCGAPIGR